MPLLKIHSLGNQQAWGLWHISESEAELSFAAQETCPDELVSNSKRLEWLAGRALIKLLSEYCGLAYEGLRKDEFGKPFLKVHPHFISLSHSHPYVAAQIDVTGAVGIDLEQPKAKLLKIAPRVLSPSEQANAADNITKHCVYWCAKEALYKIDGERGLHFSTQLNLAPFELQASGELKGTIDTKKLKQVVDLIYIVQPDFVLVYTKPRMP